MHGKNFDVERRLQKLSMRPTAEVFFLCDYYSQKPPLIIDFIWKPTHLDSYYSQIIGYFHAKH
ncbi:MAG: hypothetical protein ACI85E_000059 [Marinomonas primoryensis]